MNNKLKLFVLGAAAIVPAAGIMLASAAGPNLIANGAFASNVNGWDNFGGNPTFDNGTMKITDNYVGEGNSYYSGWYCVKNVEPGTQYATTGEFFVPESAPEYSGADLSVFYYASNDCSGSNLLTGGGSQSGGRHAEDRGKWLDVSFKSTAPATAHSARVRATAFKEPHAPETKILAVHTVNFDNITFSEAPKLIVNPDPTQAPPKGPGDIVANPEPTQPPAGPQDLSANPQPTATPQAPDTGDSNPADQPNQDTPADSNDTGPASDGDVVPTGDTSSSKPADSGASHTTSDGDANAQHAAQGEDGAGLGLGLMLAGVGSVIALGGLAFVALARRRQTEK